MPNYLAGLGLSCSPAGNIYPSTFICIDGIQSDIFQARHCSGSGDVAIAVAQVGTDNAPNLGFALFGINTAQPAAQPGEPVQTFDIGDVAPIVLGAGGASGGSLLTWDASGQGVMTPNGSGTRYGAVALQPGNAGDIIYGLLVVDRA